MVAGGTALTWLQLEYVGKLFAELFRIGDALAFVVLDFVLLEILHGVVFQVVNFLQRTHFIFWGAVAIEAEAHGVRLSMIDDFHFIDLAVAAHTGNTAIDVGAVAEFYVVGRFVDFHPLDRLAIVKWMSFVHRTMQWIQLGAIALHVLVAVPASICGR